jgi:hypothetical protein
VREEVEHIGGDHLGRLVVDHREEGLQTSATARSVFGRARPATNSR